MCVNCRGEQQYVQASFQATDGKGYAERRHSPNQCGSCAGKFVAKFYAQFPEQQRGKRISQSVEEQREHGKVCFSSTRQRTESDHGQCIERCGCAQYLLARVVNKAFSCKNIARIAEGDERVINGARAGDQPSGESKDEYKAWDKERP